MDDRVGSWIAAKSYDGLERRLREVEAQRDALREALLSLKRMDGVIIPVYNNEYIDTLTIHRIVDAVLHNTETFPCPWDVSGKPCGQPTLRGTLTEHQGHGERYRLHDTETP